MNREEAIKICRLAKAASPAQAVDEYTPDLWALALRGDQYADAEEAVVQLVREQEWMHLSHIVTRMKRIRRKRLEEFGVLPDPPADMDPADTDAYHAWMVEMRRAIADGEITNPTPALEVGPLDREAAKARVGELRAQLARRAPTPEPAMARDAIRTTPQPAPEESA